MPSYQSDLEKIALDLENPKCEVGIGQAGAIHQLAQRIDRAIVLRLIAHAIANEGAAVKLNRLRGILECDTPGANGGSHPVEEAVAPKRAEPAFNFPNNPKLGEFLEEKIAERSSGGGEATRRVGESPDGGPVLSPTEAPLHQPIPDVTDRRKTNTFRVKSGPLVGFHYSTVVTCEGCGEKRQAASAARADWPAPDLCPACAAATEPDPVPEVADEDFRRCDPVGDDNRRQIERGIGLARMAADHLSAHRVPADHLSAHRVPADLPGA
jgi:hypothetical protein